ncbi:hypothetical protein GCM10027289_04040 [Tsukamurella serpentis]
MTRTFAALALAVCLVLAGCSSTPAREDRPTITPAQPALAPEPAAPPAGSVTAAGAGEGLAFDPAGRRLAAITDGAVVLYSVDGGLREVAKVSTPGRANQVVPQGAGPGFLVATGDGVLRIDDDRAGTVQKIDGGALTVAPYDAGTKEAGKDGAVWALAGTATGRIVLLRSGADNTSIDGPVEASRILVRGQNAAVVDRLQASITEVGVGGPEIGRSLRVGRGITNAAIDSFGRIFAVDTGKNQVIGYTVEPFMERFLYPVPDAPWAVDYDESAGLMWVTKTATNQVVGYSLGSGMPEQRMQFPTVRQPNAIAVDAKTATLYVQSATGGGIQAIPTK